MSKVLVGLSGGVDSSVAALLLKRQGYEVIGVTMVFWSPDRESGEGGCGAGTEAEDARRVAEAIGIPHVVLDFREVFREKVIDYFTAEYLEGRTPNPCVMCNRHVKWQALLEQADAMGAEYIATGHYARIRRLPGGRYTVCHSVTAAKDQTYALCQLTQEQLARTLMPVGDHSKEEIRRIALEARLPAAVKPDSMEICFIPDHDYAAYVRSHGDREILPGNFVDREGKVLGQHRGIVHYTVGQRKGLGITFGKPMFVVEIRPDTREVVLGEGKDVFTDHLICDRLNYMAIPDLTEDLEVTAKIRYSHGGAPCRIHPLDGDRVECFFREPVRAVTPGQAVVFYRGDMVAAGGRILGG